MKLLEAAQANNATEVRNILNRPGSKQADITAALEMVLFKHLHDVNADLVRFLVDGGARVEKRPEDSRDFWRVLSRGDICEILDEADEQSCPPLVDAVRSCKFKNVTELIAAGEDVNCRSSQGRTPLIWAAIRCRRGGHFRIPRPLIDSGADVNLSSPGSGRTALMEAVDWNHVGTVHMLIRSGANVNANDLCGWTALMIAARNGDFRLVRELLAFGANSNDQNERGETALMLAAKTGDFQSVEFLLNPDFGKKTCITDERSSDQLHSSSESAGHEAHAADPNLCDCFGGTALMWALDYEANSASNPKFTFPLLTDEQRAIRIVRSLLEHGANPNALDRNGESCLARAVEKGKTSALLQDLLSAGANPNAGKYSPLLVASRRGDADAATLLAVAGADLQAKEGRAEWTPLIMAAHNRHSEVVRCLLNAGATVDERNQLGETALMWAACVGDCEMLQMLLAAGANINARNKVDWTPLMYSVLRNNLGTAECLVKLGADSGIRNSDGKTALDFAQKEGRSDIARIIRAGMKTNQGRIAERSRRKNAKFHP